MKVCHIIGIFSPEHGGPVISCRNYCIAQSDKGLDVSLFTIEGYRNTSPAVRLSPPIRQHVERVNWPEKLGRSSALFRALDGGLHYDIYHLHGIWLRAMYYGYRAANRQRRPYLVEINGALDPLELATKPWRKRLIRIWYQDKILHGASCIHVNSWREADHIRSLGYKAPIAVIPAGFNIPESRFLLKEARENTPTWANELKGKRIFLYLARIHEAKGIRDLLDAWHVLVAKFPDWMLLVAGPGNFEEVIKSNNANVKSFPERVQWIGMISEMEKAWAFSNAELYVLPSHKENFGNTVQEALGYGTPVITTTKTPWLELAKWGCGWVCEDNPSKLAEALEDALSKSEAELKTMGKIGQKIIYDRFSLNQIAADQIDVYKWIAGGDMPLCVSRN